MKKLARLIIATALLLEFALALFPPMRLAMLDQSTGFMMGRTEHHFVFARRAGGWTIDGGRFAVYTALIASAVGLTLVAASGQRGRTKPSGS